MQQVFELAEIRFSLSLDLHIALFRFLFHFLHPLHFIRSLQFSVQTFPV